VSAAIQILPIHGEGDHRAAVVEGVRLLATPVRPAPSVSAARCYLPVDGKDL